MYDPADELKPSETTLTILLHKYTFQRLVWDQEKKTIRRRSSNMFASLVSRGGSVAPDSYYTTYVCLLYK